MKTIYLLIIFSALSLSVMIVVDYILGAKAEFLNAYSVVQRLLGRHRRLAIRWWRKNMEP